MGNPIKRFGVSLDRDLLDNFDVFCRKAGYASRSEAIRDLIRDRLINEQCHDEETEAVGILGLVYSHDTPDLTETLTRIQHENIHIILSSSHIHLSRHNCLEVILLKGECGTLRSVAEQLISIRNVKHGKLVLTSTGKDL